jgi:hypothetical protein
MDPKAGKRKTRGGSALLRNPTAIARWESEDGVLITNVEDGCSVITNEPGLIVWFLCDGERTRLDVHATLAATYLMSDETVDAVDRVLERFIATGLVLQRTTPVKERPYEADAQFAPRG